MYSHIYKHLSSFLSLPTSFSKLQACKRKLGRDLGIKLMCIRFHVQCNILFSNCKSVTCHTSQCYLHTSFPFIYPPTPLATTKTCHHLLCQGSKNLSQYLDSLRYSICLLSLYLWFKTGNRESGLHIATEMLQ